MLVLSRKQMHELKNDPFLLGHFSDNEMPWRLEMLDRYLELKKSEEGYIAAAAWLKEQGVNPFQITDQIREAFVEYAAEKYFSIVKRAIKKLCPESNVSRVSFSWQNARFETVV